MAEASTTTSGCDIAPYEHVYNMLNRRKYISLSDKKEMLKGFCSHRFDLEDIDTHMAAFKETNQTKWNEPCSAARITEIYIEFQKHESVRPRNAALRLLKNSMDRVKKALQQWRAR